MKSLVLVIKLVKGFIICYSIKVWKVTYLKWNADKTTVDEINDHPGGG